MSSQVNLHALNTLTAYISAFREIAPSPAELVEFSQSRQDAQELSRKEGTRPITLSICSQPVKPSAYACVAARRIIKLYKKNLNDCRSGQVVYSSRTRSDP